MPPGTYLRLEGGSAFFDPDPDGQRFLMMRIQGLGDVPDVTILVQNFHEELKRLLPR